ncbi:hypothetical protein BDV95DRAFT_382485 [Massariosphaeria phaeospora]|uniref:J domain-containing protein n=1 Tax=Massariosphaeria phaeospora TaxID=100035 RepID=A0A7C8I768_9PLEO|nr:hypothetical protein BDV95DRAFT_382485 [Massariosphaeria phaeospora]
MPLRFEHILQPRPHWICQPCLARQNRFTVRPRHRLPLPQPASAFHTTSPNRSDNAVLTHYETLQIAPTASPADIKRQFFTLSKRHHPDKNPHDPTASTRFVAISEAYHVLSVPEKRAKYDAQLGPSLPRGGADYPRGSYSSASFAGSRPATGLNKKRGTFRGPPPSFYKTGGYGAHGAKRAEHAYQDSAHSASREGGTESYGDFGAGFGPGQKGQGHEVPHFDDRKHKETHDHVHDHIYARRHRERSRRELDEEIDRGGHIMNFILVAGAVGLIGLSAKILTDRNEGVNRLKKSDGSS